uniref:Uncharacterized protein n=1 Tax=Physcomitrium patens TaxID=3218 RepID=A0A2K1IIV3_PHYPA|nr:hypothetical protein PHYPA_027896 [Physcomitrium patens]
MPAWHQKPHRLAMEPTQHRVQYLPEGLVPVAHHNLTTNCRTMPQRGHHEPTFSGGSLCTCICGHLYVCITRLL